MGSGASVSRDESRGGKRRRRLFPVAVAVTVLGLVGYAFGRYVLVPPTSSSGAPQYVGSLKLARLIEGEEALSQINRLHGTSIGLKKAFIAEYQPAYGGEHLMVWAGEASSEAAAEELIRLMVEGIKRGGAGFANPREVQMAGHTHWQADGDGGGFFFYRSREPGDRVVWLTIQGGGSAALLESAVKLF